jgi:hypothetical protein
MMTFEQGRHCPFLEQADARCSAHFRLDQVRQAFKFCFGRPTTCPLYLQLRVEARVASMNGVATEVDLERDGHANPPAASAAIPDASGR